MEESYYIGSDLKFALSITVQGGGFDQATSNYDIDIYCGSKKLHYTQEDIYADGGEYYLMVPTSELRPGTMKMVVTAYVEDDAFESGYRREVDVRNIATIKNI